MTLNKSRIAFLEDNLESTYNENLEDFPMDATRYLLHPMIEEKTFEEHILEKVDLIDRQVIPFQQYRGNLVAYMEIKKQIGLIIKEENTIGFVYAISYDKEFAQLVNRNNLFKDEEKEIRRLNKVFSLPLKEKQMLIEPIDILVRLNSMACTQIPDLEARAYGWQEYTLIMHVGMNELEYYKMGFKK